MDGPYPPWMTRRGSGRAFLERYLPETSEDASRHRGWDELDVIIVTGDAHVDHPSFGAAMIGRLLESHGYRVGILAQPDWKDPAAFRRLGRPRLFFGVTAGNMDSMLANRTSRGKRRSSDSYSPSGRPGLRPDRATIVYTQRIREVWPGSVVVLGGIEASLRRLAHYDFTQEMVRGSLLLDSGADLLVHGMGERAVLQIAFRLQGGEDVSSIVDVPGTTVRLDEDVLAAHESCPSSVPGDGFAVVLPSLEKVRSTRRDFTRMTRAIQLETNPFNARDLVQRHGREGVRANAPALPLTTQELDNLHDLPYTRMQHPSCDGPVPALVTVRHSITIMRGCFGGCSFCALSVHQGRVIQSRSIPGVLREVELLRSQPGFTGTVTDLGGPTANLYGSGCGSDKRLRSCRRTSCVSPRICHHLVTEPGPLLSLMRAVRTAPGVKRALVASGVRMDVALRAEGYIEELAAHHVGGQLSVAPEHVSGVVLEAMRKPPISVTERFATRFEEASRDAGKKQYLVLYFMSGHPGTGLAEMIEAALWLQSRGYRPRQVQQFVPVPMTVSAAMHHTGFDPMNGRQVRPVRDDREKRMQKALLMYWDPAMRDLVQEALRLAGRGDLVGGGMGRLLAR